MTAAVTAEQVRAVLDAVPDPEMPPVTVGDLGMVHAVTVIDGRDHGGADGTPHSSDSRERGERADADGTPHSSDSREHGERADAGGPGGVRVEVDLIPTFTGCPATHVIREEVARALGRIAGVDEVEVRFCFDETWTPARITERGRERLRSFAIAPPEERPRGGGCLPRRPRPDGGSALPVQQPGLRQRAGGPPDLQAHRPACPICGSADTVEDSPFGPTPCRSTHYCNACRNPFEAIKP